MILSKAFKLDKLLQTSSKNNNYIKIDPNQVYETKETNKTFIKGKIEMSKRETKKKSSPLSVLKQSEKADSVQNNDFYEGDGELSVVEVFKETSTSVAGATVNATISKYDLILFPRVLDLCITYIISVKQQQKIDLNIILGQSGEIDEDKLVRFSQKYSKFNLVVEQFLKRLLYLLESCNLNVHIMLNNVRYIKKTSKLIKYFTTFFFLIT
jgi:hypothetical protein